jgi:hypothetical protein
MSEEVTVVVKGGMQVAHTQCYCGPAAKSF